MSIIPLTCKRYKVRVLSWTLETGNAAWSLFTGQQPDSFVNQKTTTQQTGCCTNYITVCMRRGWGLAMLLNMLDFLQATMWKPGHQRRITMMTATWKKAGRKLATNWVYYQQDSDVIGQENSILERQSLTGKDEQSFTNLQNTVFTKCQTISE